MLVLFGSETGTAEDAANRIVRECCTRGLDACALPMNCMADSRSLAQESLVVFVCATTGTAAATCFHTCFGTSWAGQVVTVC